MPLKREIWRLGLAALFSGALLGSSCIVPNNAPVINSLESEKELVKLSDSSEVECIASDQDGDSLTYHWSATGGVFSGTGPVATWTAPHTPGTYTITVMVIDGRGGEATMQLSLEVVANAPPVIESLTAEPMALERGGTITIECVASDPDGDEFGYRWSAAGGDISGQGSAVTWTAPSVLGDYTITVVVIDGRGGEAAMQLSLEVVANSPPVIESLTAEPMAVGRGGTSVIECVASDPDGDEFSYRWSAAGGDIGGQGSAVTWTAPQECGSYFISVTVADTRGGEASEQLEVVVSPG